MKKFWNWIRDDAGGRVLRLEGPIDSESFWGDEITPQDFRAELEAEEGDVTVWINSEGGNVFAAAEIYTMLRDYAGRITVKIASLAASAASVVAMAGDEILMSPTAMLFLHDPATVAMGNARDMEKAIETLHAVKESIINAYRAKTGLSRGKISQIMENESFIHAEEALKLGFCDGILFGDGTASQNAQADPPIPKADSEVHLFSTKQMNQSIMNYLNRSTVTTKDETETGTVDTQTGAPVIGMDGKTETGAMPYELLMHQLDYLR